jgi:fibrillarin-like rRNA methylase
VYVASSDVINDEMLLATGASSGNICVHVTALIQGRRVFEVEISSELENTKCLKSRWVIKQS